MSYEIFYRTAFIKVSDNEVIPVVEAGSNNVYDWKGKHGTSRRARNFQSLWFEGCKKLILTKTELETVLNKVRDYYANEYETCADDVYEDKHFGYFAAIALYGKGTRNTTWNSFKNFFLKKGCNESLTIEQWKERNVIFEVCSSYISSDYLEKIDKAPYSKIVSTVQELRDAIQFGLDYYKGTNVDVIVKPTESWGIDNYYNKLSWERKEISLERKREKKQLEQNHYYEILSALGTYISGGKRRYKYSQYGNGKKFRTETEAKRRVNKLNQSWGDGTFWIKKREGYVVFNV